MDGILDWYLLGVAMGLGVAGGIAAVGGLVSSGVIRVVWVLFAAACIAAGVVLGLLTLEWWAVVATAVAAAVGLLAYRRLSSDAVPAAWLLALVLAAIPVAGYVLVVVSPVLGQRLGRQAGQRYAGLRILAKD